MKKYAAIAGLILLVGAGYWVYDRYLALDFGRSSAAGLVCAPSTPVILPGQTVTFFVQGSGPTPKPTAGIPERSPLPPRPTPVPVYKWSAPKGNPSSGTGTTFTTQYLYGGQYTVTVTLGRQAAKCRVAVSTSTPPPPSWTPTPSGTPTPYPTPTPQVPAIVVGQPNPGSSFGAGGSMFISWKTYSYPPGVPVSIYLLRRSLNKGVWEYGVAAVINEKATNDGNETWQIPQTIRTGSDFFIQVGCPSGYFFPAGCVGDISDGPFTIYPPTPAPSVPPQGHLTCVNRACVMVAGPGMDTCGSDIDCAY